MAGKKDVTRKKKVFLTTLQRAARMVGRSLRLELV